MCTELGNRWGGSHSSRPLENQSTNRVQPKLLLVLECWNRHALCRTHMIGTHGLKGEAPAATLPAHNSYGSKLWSVAGSLLPELTQERQNVTKNKRIDACINAVHAVHSSISASYIFSGRVTPVATLVILYIIMSICMQRQVLQPI